jgi:chemotaxis signal transduction protein
MHNSATPERADAAQGSATAPLHEILNRFTPSNAARLAGLPRADDVRARYGFGVGTLGLLVAPLTGLEVVTGRGVAPLPRCPAWFSGMMNLRGHPVPVFDLRTALEVPAAPDAGSANVLVLEGGSRALGILIDGFPRPLRSLSRTAVPASLPLRLQPFVLAAWLDSDSLWIEFDHRALFLSLSGRSSEALPV